ncbi:hypothetical protein ACLOJK_009698 [Asimina triloba]
MSSESGGKKSRTIKLFCPSDASKLVRFVACEDDGIDVGTIARCFGVDPTTLRLNGHFLSRGPHLISAVTWKSLLSFFHSRGFPTGADGQDAIVVDGKRSCGSDERSGFAGPHNPSHNQIGNDFVSLDSNGGDVLGSKRKPWLEEEHFSLLKRRKTDQCNSGTLPY